MDEFTAALVARGLDPSRIHSERFGAVAALTLVAVVRALTGSLIPYVPPVGLVAVQIDGNAGNGDVCNGQGVEKHFPGAKSGDPVRQKIQDRI
jgi:hypothetical protein